MPLARIDRHEYPTDEVPDTLDALTETTDWILDEFAGSPVLRPQALSTTLALAQQHCAVDPQAVRFDSKGARYSSRSGRGAMTLS
ncbi:hypothetical protein ABT024_40675, partial [Streptomyces sp. NPDC002812]